MGVNCKFACSHILIVIAKLILHSIYKQHQVPVI